MILHTEAAGAYYGAVLLNLQRKCLCPSQALVGYFSLAKI